MSVYKNKVVVITGAGGILCSEIAKEYAKYGAKIAVLDLNLEAAEASRKYGKWQNTSLPLSSG